MNLPETSGLMVWLLPDRDHAHLFSKFIVNLSEQYSTIPFTPHVTLSRVPNLEREKIVKKTARLSNLLAPVKVEVGEVLCRSHPYRKITLQLDDEVMIWNYFNAVNECFGGEYCKENDFHLSLMYGNQKCEDIDLEKIRREAPVIHELHLQRIAVVDLNFTPDKWKIIFEQSL